MLSDRIGLLFHGSFFGFS